jgi:hypothetical protein
MESMQSTLDLAIELSPMMANMYGCMPLPGSQVYKDAIESGYVPPKDYVDYSFHSYTTVPVPNKNLTSEEILKFRDEAYVKYHTNPKFLNKVKDKYGDQAVANILENTKIKLKRKILGD